MMVCSGSPKAPSARIRASTASVPSISRRSFNPFSCRSRVSIVPLRNRRVLARPRPWTAAPRRAIGRIETATMTSGPFDFAPLLPAGLPAPAVKWKGFPEYNFIGGHNDAEQVPVDRLTAAATAVLAREGATLATYGLASGPLGYRPLREFLADKLERTAGIACASDEILITSGSLQALDLVNGLLLARGDTVLIEQESYQGSLNRLARRGINAVGIPLDRGGMRIDAAAAALDDLARRGIRAKYIYTIPTVQNPTGTIMGEERRRELL